jgi:transposase
MMSFAGDSVLLVADSRPSPKERAVAMRLAGKSRAQIMAALHVSKRTLSRYLEGVPPAVWTKRPRAKDDLRAQAVEMRKEDGRSYKEIAAILDVSLSSCSLWLKEIKLSAEQRQALEARSHASRVKAAHASRDRRIERQRQTRRKAAAEIGSVTERELWLAGVLLYWAEGAKAKPWNPKERVQFTNSDPGLVLLFIRWLELCGVSREALTLRVSIHETAAVDDAVEWWADCTGLPVTQFRRSQIKRHNPSTNRHNRGSDYHGCLMIDVRRSTELYRWIEGWYEGILMAGGVTGSTGAFGAFKSGFKSWPASVETSFSTLFDARQPYAARRTA